MNYVKSKNMIMKFIGESTLIDNEVSIRVEPVIIDKNSLYSHINYEQNYIEFKGENFDHLAFQGIGAGRYPTASAVVNDIIQIKNGNTKEFHFNNKHLIVNSDLHLSRYLVLSKGKFEVTKEITISELKMTYKQITCFARIDGDMYV